MGRSRAARPAAVVHGLVGAVSWLGGAAAGRASGVPGPLRLDTTKIYLRMVPGHLKEEYEKEMPEIAVGVNDELSRSTRS